MTMNTSPWNMRTRMLTMPIININTARTIRRASRIRTCIAMSGCGTATRTCRICTTPIGTETAELSKVKIDAYSSDGTSTGNPAARHSGRPSSSLRTLNPFFRRMATVSNDKTQYAPRQ